MSTRQKFIPRPYQTLIINHILDGKRVAVWAGMGTGKTVATLSALEILQMVEDGPALVVAPLRVATTTWPEEVLKWEHLKGMNVVPIVGTERERIAAVRSPSQVYTTNYEQLVWLVAYWGDKWPYATVVLDESTKVKGFRLRQGGKRAQALGSITHTRIKRLIELTGTPASNGLKDLWGQSWFLDAGTRLGRTFTAFSQRWFRPDRTGYGVEPLAIAQAEIQDKLRDVCLTIEAKDWFDLREPIINNIMVKLPLKARKHYKEMEVEMYTALDTGDEIEAFNAAAKTQKCLAEGTELLTKTGWKRIEDFDVADELWDGKEWVGADSLVCNGYRDVVECFHVTMTPDHKVLTNRGWFEAAEVNRDTTLTRKDVWLPDNHSSRGVHERDLLQACALASPLRMRQRDNHSWIKYNLNEPGLEKILRMQTPGDAFGCVGHARDDRPSCVGVMGQYEIAMPEPKRQGLEKLRGSWYKSLQFVAFRFCKFLARYVQDVPKRFNNRTHQQPRGLFTGKLPMGHDYGTSQQSSNECYIGDNRRAHDYGASCTEEQYAHRDIAGKISPGVAAGKGPAPIRKKVYDIVNCGPRNCFTVRGTDNVPLIVHNCLQIANGAMYVGDGALAWQEVHTAKLEALESVIEEAAGMPVLVAYNFKSDLARLLKHFPQGRHLDKKPETIKEWNAGRIPVLFAHPASAGHGLNLQDGGNILVFFSVNWNLEEHLQIIERIGPTRQLQSGYDRPVFIHRILARDTVDELVLQRLETKREVQDILMDAMKHRRKAGQKKMSGLNA